MLIGDAADTADAAGARRGRPPGTSRRELELIALRLFTDQGFEATTIEQIAAEAGVSKRTFFRYFSSKAGVLWSEFDREVSTIRQVCSVPLRRARSRQSPSRVLSATACFARCRPDRAI